MVNCIYFFLGMHNILLSQFVWSLEFLDVHIEEELGRDW